MQTKDGQTSKISFVIPVYNEQETLQTLVEKISVVMTQEHLESYEIIFVDDGSTDSSWSHIEQLVAAYPQYIKALKFRKNFGKSVALQAGFQMVQGDIVFTLDADLQDDPAEIPRFLQQLQAGFDLVSGWRIKRQDPLSKTLPSKIFNKVTALLTGIKLHDFNCGFKAYRREVIECIDLYGELHRYIPVLAHEFGFKAGEVAIQHHPRTHGVSKYGFERYARGFLDLLTVITVTRYLEKPAHLFGGFGIIFGVFGSISLTYLVILWILGFRPIGNRPLLLFGILAMILAVQLLSLGLIAELSRRSNDPPEIHKLVQKTLGSKN